MDEPVVVLLIEILVQLTFGNPRIVIIRVVLSVDDSQSSEMMRTEEIGPHALQRPLERHAAVILLIFGEVTHSRY